MNILPKITPHLSDFEAIPLKPLSDDRFHLVIFRDAQGELRLAQWVLGAFPEGVKPIYYHPVPVDRLDLSGGFHERVKAKLSRWDQEAKEAIA